MMKFWLVFKHEYLSHVLRKRFIFALLSMPIFTVLLVGVGYLAVMADYDSRPIAYVDNSGVFKDAVQVPPSPNATLAPIQIVAYASEDQARKDLEAKKIQTYFVIDAQYLKNGKVKMVAVDTAKENSRNDFNDFLKFNLLQSQPAEVAKRVLSGPEVTVQSLTSSRQMGNNDILNFILPVVAGLLFIVLINTSGSYLVQALVDEKENRTMEIVVTSVSSGQLMGGKIVADLLVGWTELAAWVGFSLLGLAFARRFIPGAGTLNINFDTVWLTLLTLIPASIMVAALMAMAGATTTDSREAQQLAGVFTMPVIVPYFLLAHLMEFPNSPLSVGLSLFPLTAPISLAMRAGFTDIPAWQIIVSFMLLIFCALGALWVASRAFRLGMLRYGKRLPWRVIFGKAG